MLPTQIEIGDMPFTPFHFGPGAAIKAVVPASFSLGIFCFAQVVMDLESGYHLLLGDYPVHRFLHTYLGATLVAPVCAIGGKYSCEYLLRGIQTWGLRLGTEISWPAAFLSAFLGTESHVLLDSIMHSDVVPFSPWSHANPFLHVIGLGTLHLLCLILGAIGLIGILFHRNRLRRK